jgi:chromosome segregation ATPase
MGMFVATHWGMSVTHPAPSTAPAQARGRDGRRTRQLVGIARTLLVALLCGVVGYVGGLVHGALRARAPAQRLAARLATLAHEVDGAQREVQRERETRASLVGHTELYSAYRSAERALRALDARNFGIADAELRKAEQKIRALVPTLPQLEPVQRKVSSAHVTVAEDLSTQRAELSDLVTALDSVISDREQGVLAPILAP